MKRSAQTLFLRVFTIVATATSVVYSPGAAAQPTTVKPATGDDLRAAYATAVEAAEGKRIAEASCARCHGANGISTTKGVPHLAGQRPAYLYAKLRAYQTGARRDHSMEAVRFLSDDALVQVAAHYASLEPAQPLATGGAKTAPAKPDPVAAGKAAAAACAGCHGEGGISKIPGMPSLIGLYPKYLTAAMTAYKSGQRKHDAMESLAAAVSDADLNNIALYYALQKPARAQTPAAGNQAAGKAAAAACAACHGEQGVSGNPTIPSLAGQDAQYLAAATRAYKDGSRKEETMKAVVAALSDRTIGDLAAYYASQEPRSPKVEKPLTLAEWVQRCDRCHGVSGNSTDPGMPALAAQRAEYLAKGLRAYQTGARKASVMAAMSGALTDADVEALAAHYARQRARAIVYVPLPSR